jgi:thymidylate kinase
VLLAHDRRALLTRAFARSANGEIVLCDRYPSTNEDALDGAQLGGDRAAAGPIRRRLAGLEARLYSEIPPPDLVIQLTAPLHVTLERNRTRTKSEPDEYVLSRHARSTRLEFERARVAEVDTDRPLEDATREIRRVIWDAL